MNASNATTSFRRMRAQKSASNRSAPRWSPEGERDELVGPSELKPSAPVSGRSDTETIRKPRIRGRVVQFVDPSEDARREILSRRAELLMKDTRSSDEEAELELLEWKLERIEGRELAPDLDRLDRLARLGEMLAAQVSEFGSQLDRLAVQRQHGANVPPRRGRH